MLAPKRNVSKWPTQPFPEASSTSASKWMGNKVGRFMRAKGNTQQRGKTSNISPSQHSGKHKVIRGIKNTCSPIDNQIISQNPTAKRYICRKTETFPCSMEENNIGQGDSKNNSRGVGNSFYHKPSKTKQNSGRCKYEPLKKKHTFRRSERHVTKRGNSKNKTNRKSILKQYISQGKERSREIQTYNKSKATESPYSIPKIQNGIPKKSEGSSGKRRSDDKNRSKGCIFYDSSKQEIKEICSLPMGRKPVRIHLPYVRSRSLSPTLYKNSENPNFPFKTLTNKVDNLYRRHASDGFLNVRNTYGKGHTLALTRSLRIYNQSGKIHSYTHPNNRFSGSTDKQQNNENVNSRRENELTKSPLPRNNPQQGSISKGLVQIDWAFAGDSTSIYTSPPPTTKSPTGAKSSPTEKIDLRNHDFVEEGSNGGTALVVRKHSCPKWERNILEKSGSNNIIGCIDFRMGSGLPGKVHRGDMEQRGEITTHKYFGNEGSRTSHKNFHQNNRKQTNTYENRQYLCTSISGEHGGYKMPNDEQNNKINMVVSHSKENNMHSRIHSFRTQCRGGQGVTNKGPKRLETQSNHFQKCLQKTGKPNNRLVCVVEQPPTETLHQLETRSTVHSSGCFPAELGAGIPICFPSFQFGGENFEKAPISYSEHDHDYTSMAITNLVPPPTSNVHYQSNNTSTDTRHFTRPSGQHSPSDQSNEISGMVGVRQCLEAEGVSKRASMLITKSRSLGTRSNYESAWKKFCGWCDKQKINPIQCSINYVLDYLAELFETKLEYRTINNHRSAISAFHCPIDGFKIGQHPKVTSLLKGVSNERPPKPRYSFVWDVEEVLKRLNTQLPYENMSHKQVTLKVSMLLALTTISRVSELHNLNIDYMMKKNDLYEFGLNNRVKHSRQGKLPPPISFHRFETNPSMPVPWGGRWVRTTPLFVQSALFDLTKKIFFFSYNRLIHNLSIDY